MDPVRRPATGRHVLRLCSVFEPLPARGDTSAVDGRAARFDPIGGMQNHTATLTRCLDAQGSVQTVVTSRLAGRRGRVPMGRAAVVHRTGLRVPWLRQLWALDALRVVLRPGARPVDVVHAHQGEDLATLLLARLAARRHGCPLVVTVHCSVGHTLRGRGLRTRLLRALGGWIERSALSRADAVVVLTDRTAAALMGDGVPAERVTTIPSGFDPGLFAGDHPDVFPGAGRPRMGYVGRLAPQKRADRLVEAFGRMREPAHLVVVGDGPDRDRVRQLAAASPRADRVTLSGFVEHPAVPAVLASLDVLVLPSAYEEMGSVLTEAMASGLPVVASDVGGIPEVVRGGVTGLLVPPGDVDALAAALDRLAADPGLRARLSAGARARAADYSWPQLAARVAAVYARVREEELLEAAA
ncbi:glycosyltransferase family 1 protein [Geodermatophilus sp. DF01-2]|uniref:glycosyltransferase family 4 protein n=1 Tax=Geodermatophilus sp. DF01-2 TaxID=2559610 RepID=UPI00107472A1|nr:glycosyltransferase [Geodermatophilus sp. DF01_2]TFV58573.1 glycosyltransferase family 1 protein [Geodermatophilus sp. DF01_2]